MDINGTKIYSAVYDAYGGVLNTSPHDYDPVLKFSGKERDHESELDYFGARYYDHSHYRFISTDPIINKEEALSNPQLWNLYSYCRNNPVTYLDFDGRTDIKINVVREFARVNSILGRLSVEGTNISGYTLELPWRNNQTDISAIPLGEYPAMLDDIGRSYLHLRFMNVESRSDIEMHGGQISENTQGCILVGRNRSVRNEMISDRSVLTETTNLILALNYIDRTILHEPTNITVNVSVDYSEAVNSLRNFSRSLYRNIFNY
jgi:RHS repeat-associated protein